MEGLELKVFIRRELEYIQWLLDEDHIADAITTIKKLAEKIGT